MSPAHMLAPFTTPRFFRLKPHRIVSLAIALVSLAVLPSALAAEPDALIAEGKKLVAAKKYDEACPKFADAYAANKNPATLVDLALCHEKQGKLTTAWSELLDAEAEARKAGRSDVETRARANSKALEPKLPRIVINVAAATPGLEVTIDGQKVDPNAQAKGRPVDPGDHKVVASAAGRKPFETTVTVKAGQSKPVVIPALAADASAPADKPADKPGDKPADKPSDKPPPDGKDGTPKDPPPPPPDKPDDPSGPLHRSGRIVVDAGITAGGQLFLGGGSLAALSSLTYEYRVTDPLGAEAVELGVCDSSTCRALIDPSFGVPIGGQVFVGFAAKETLHVGGRFFGAYLPTGGFSLLVGPSLSTKVADRLWVGGTLLVGWGAQNAAIVGARGTVPSDWVDYNGADEVDVILSRTIPEEDDVGFGFSFGAAAEVSFRLAEFGNGKSLSTGSLLLNAWPTFLKTSDGFAITLPVGASYRFH